MKNMTTESYEKGLKEDLINPVEAAEYLNAALEDAGLGGLVRAGR